nr:cellulase family glycosylhydrolase [Lachnospiraceae bacterium]
NRIAFHEAFKDMKNDPVMEGRPLSVIMVDLDRLKKINDTLGHDAGDRAIAAVADALRNAVPDNSLCVRFGGDEMLSFIPGVERCDEILDSIDDYLGKESEKAGYRIAASCGSYTTTIHPDIDMEQIVKLADEEMYVIKREHREIYSKEDIMFSLKKGVNLGGWMSQCDYSKDRLDNFIKEEDFAVIASWGVDHVRLPVDYNVIQNDDMSINFEGFDRIARAISLAEKNNLKLVIDLHKTPGYSFDKDEGEAGFFENEKLQEQFYLLWEHFAKLFGSKPDTVYFELLNEVTNKEYIDPWNRIWKTCVKRIRAIAPDTPILVGSYYHNAVSTVKFLDKPEEKNVIYNFHCYEPLKFTHQGAHWVDVLDQNARVSFAESGATVEYFEEMFADAIQKSKEDGIPLYCGEYGVIDVAKPEDALEWFKVINAVFEKHGIGRAAWSYRQMDFGLSDARMDKVRDELIKYL